MYRSVLSCFSLADGGMVTVCRISETGNIAGNPRLKAAAEMSRGIYWNFAPHVEQKLTV